MPAKYSIHPHPAPPKHKMIGKYGIVDWREDCSACHNCVKRECFYGVYNDERDRLVNNGNYADYLYECKGCLSCVQSCTKGLLTWEVNPEFESLGDEVWTPQIIASTWYQAEAGGIPVSGAGYGGRFRGPGFDSILTDMSEIVRPTRDGIHGREYISTAVDIGRKALSLSFDEKGGLLTKCDTIVEVPLPIIFNMMPWHSPGPVVSKAILDAAQKLSTYAITDDPALINHPAAIPHISEQAKAAPGSRKLMQWVDCPDVVQQIKEAKTADPDLVAVVMIPLGPSNIERSMELARQGVDALHVFADWRGAVADSVDGSILHISDAVRLLHQAIVNAGIRDQITLIASGGISMAEHIAKTLLCGADLLAIDVPLMIALECRVCENCRGQIQCPVDLADVDGEYAVQRMVNLMVAWHNQLLEMMGAMGIRDARRLRGEVGRAMFFDDLERECFGPIFGRKKAEVG